jgi:hypothetical protein
MTNAPGKNRAREYFWFGVILIVVLLGSAAHAAADTVIESYSSRSS